MHQKTFDPVADSALPGMAEGAIAVPSGDGYLSDHGADTAAGGAADRMMTTMRDRRRTEDYQPVEWWSAEASGEP